MAEKTERELAQANIAENRKAFHDYHLLETFEAGIALMAPRSRRSAKAESTCATASRASKTAKSISTT